MATTFLRKGIYYMGKCVCCGRETERKIKLPAGGFFLCGYTCEIQLNFKLYNSFTVAGVCLDDIIYAEPFGEPSEPKKVKGKLQPVVKTYGDKIYQFLNQEKNNQILMNILSSIADCACNSGIISSEINEAISTNSANIEIEYIKSLSLDELLLVREDDIVNDEAREALENRIKEGK